MVGEIAIKASAAEYAGTNLIDFAEKHATYRNPAYRFEVSSRKIIPTADAIDYLKIYYPYLDIEQIESVFGNAVYPSRFYGGRSYQLEHSLTDRQIEELNANGKGVTFTLTGHYFDESVYMANRHFLERHHRKGNAIVCTNDELARRIRSDFPDYMLKASLIKHLNTPEKVERALEIYDRVIIPMDKNDDDAFLERLPEKHRIVLFANANCAYSCPARTCYTAISQSHWGRERTSACSKKWLERSYSGHTFFDVDKFFAMGFWHFKLVPRISVEARELLCLRAANAGKVNAVSPEPDATIHSFPECGLTWLRTLLANYFDRHFALHVPVDMQTLFTIIPNIHTGLKGREHYQFAHVEKMPFLLANLAMNGECRDGDILLLRSIPGVVVSDLFEQQKLDAIDGDIDAYLDSGKGILRCYCRYLNRRAKNGDWRRMHILSYDGLHRDTGGELARLLHHLNVVIDAEQLQAAVADSSFDAMQKSEKSARHTGMPEAAETPEMVKVCKGKMDVYTDYLTMAQIRRMQAVVKHMLSPDAVAMLNDCGLSTDFVQHADARGCLPSPQLSSAGS